MASVNVQKPKIGSWVECLDKYGCHYLGRVWQTKEDSGDCLVIVEQILNGGKYGDPYFKWEDLFVEDWEKIADNLGGQSDDYHQSMVSEPWYHCDGNASEWIIQILTEQEARNLMKSETKTQDNSFFAERKAKAMEGIDPATGETFASQARGGGLRFL